MVARQLARVIQCVIRDRGNDLHLERLFNLRERIAIRENEFSNSRERITNPWERITYPLKRIEQFDIITIYLWLF